MTTVTSSDLDAQPLAGIRRIWHWLNTHRGIALAFLLLIVVASLLRLLTYDRFLPYEDYTDEAVHFILAQHLRGVEDVAYLPDDYYPVGTLWRFLNAGAQILTETFNPAPWLFLGDYLVVLRLISVGFGIITLFVISSIGWQLAGPWAGWLAGFIWGLTPIIVDRNSLAVPDPLIYLLVATMLSTTLRAWKKTSPGWLLVSLLAGIAIILIKVWTLTAILPFGLLALWFTYRDPRRMWRWMVVYTIIAAVSVVYFLAVINPLSIPDQPNIATFRDVGLQFMTDPNRIFNNFWIAMYPVGPGLFWLAVAGAAVAYWYNRRRQGRILDIRYIALLLVYAFLTSLVAASWTRLSLGKIRHGLPAGIALIGLWSAAVLQIVWGIQAWQSSRSGGLAKRKWLAYVPVLLCLGVLVPGMVTGNLENIALYQTRHIVEVLWTWTDNNVPVDGLVLTHRSGQLERTWNRPWGGYNGNHPFDWWYETQEEIIQQTPQDYVERGIMYFMYTDQDRMGFYNAPELEGFIEQLTLVKTLPATPGEVTGSTAYFYRMAPPQVEADFDFGGEIRLVGYDWSESALSAGDTLYFRPYWRIIDVPRTNYSMFVHLYPADEDTLITQHDGPPTTSTRLTSTWDDPEELYIGADVHLVLPDDLPAGDYRLAVGIYDYTTGERLMSPDGDDRFLIPFVVD